MNITIIGGDKRNIELAYLFIKGGHNVKLLGFEQGVLSGFNSDESISDILQNSDLVVGPIPLNLDGIHINTPLYKGDIRVDKVFDSMKKNQVFIAGKIDKNSYDLAQQYNIRVIDLMDREDMAALNCIPTAEGAIQIAMEKMGTTIFGSNILVLGFGKVGKVLSKSLKALGGKVFVAARGSSAHSWIKVYGYEPIDIKYLVDYLEDKDLIYNTIPVKILDEGILKKVNKGTMIIDVASSPGGVDFQKAEELGLKVTWALGIPGKVAPLSAARILRDTIYNIVEDLEVEK
ncbi:MAG: dipicolinate synthase subunit DpsA [Tissierellaceae bacterium]|nr:dipicolinate synthase subunit DpsA [Tissierellaceae bacterium]